MSAFHIRQARADELSMIQRLFDSARAFMRANGNMTQWTNGYPDDAQLLRDIRAGALMLLLDDETPCAVFALCGHEPTYDQIYAGAWPSDAPYLTVHRLACAVRGRGAGSFCLAYAKSRGLDVRADTHRDNLPMQKLLEKNGFRHCGIIHLTDGAERLAYIARATMEKPINKE